MLVSLFTDASHCPREGVAGWGAFAKSDLEIRPNPMASFGQAIEGKHLARLAPESRLEAIVRNSHSEPQESIRFEVPDRVGRAARTLSVAMP